LRLAFQCPPVVLFIRFIASSDNQWYIDTLMCQLIP
jgi:hypothetical protein